MPDFGLPCDEHWCPAFEVLDVAVEEVGYPVYVATIARILRSDGQPARLYGVGQSAILLLIVVDGKPVEVGAVVGKGFALIRTDIVPNSDDAQSCLLDVALGQLDERSKHGTGGCEICAAAILISVERHGIAHPGRSADEAVIGCSLAVIIVQHHGRDVNQSRADGPVHGHLASSALRENFSHRMLAVLDVVAVADVNGGIHFVLQFRTLGNGGYLDGLVDSGIDRSILKEVAWHR